MYRLHESAEIALTRRKGLMSVHQVVIFQAMLVEDQFFSPVLTVYMIRIAMKESVLFISKRISEQSKAA